MFDSLAQAVMVIFIGLLVTGGLLFISKPADKNRKFSRSDSVYDTLGECRCCCD